MIEWLRARQSQPRCGALLQQICEWKAMDRRTMRNLAKAQGIVVSHRATQVVLEEVRKHFREAIAQEKGRLATFVFQKSRRPSELPTHHRCVTVAEVIDLATLSTYVRRHEDIPSELREASIQLAGGAMSNRQRLRALAKTLGVSLQEGLRYPGAVKPRPPVRHLPEQLKHTMLSTACIRRVRSWGATTGDAAPPNPTSRTPQTLPELASLLRDPEGRLRCPFGIDVHSVLYNHEQDPQRMKTCTITVHFLKNWRPLSAKR